jgi:hypothetical protein
MGRPWRAMTLSRPHMPHMWIMIPVWIITPLYFGQAEHFVAQTFQGTLHRGVGCTLGDDRWR